MASELSRAIPSSLFRLIRASDCTYVPARSTTCFGVGVRARATSLLPAAKNAQCQQVQEPLLVLKLVMRRKRRVLSAWLQSIKSHHPDYTTRLSTGERGVPFRQSRLDIPPGLYLFRPSLGSISRCYVLIETAALKNTNIDRIEQWMEMHDGFQC